MLVFCRPAGRGYIMIKERDSFVNCKLFIINCSHLSHSMPFALNSLCLLWISLHLFISICFSCCACTNCFILPPYSGWATVWDACMLQQSAWAWVLPLLLVQLPALHPVGDSRWWLKYLDPASNVGVFCAGSVYSLGPGPALAVATTWQVNWRVGDYSFCLSLKNMQKWA